MDYEQRIEAAFAVLDLQETRNYTQVTKEYRLEQTTLTKQYKEQTVSKKVFLSEFQQCLTIAQKKTLIEQINKLTDRYISLTSQIVKNFVKEMIRKEIKKN
jgi:hypothetical protein